MIRAFFILLVIFVIVIPGESSAENKAVLDSKLKGDYINSVIFHCSNKVYNNKSKYKKRDIENGHAILYCFEDYGVVPDNNAANAEGACT